MDTARFEVAPGDRRAFSRISPGETTHFESKDAAVAHVRKGVERLTQLQQLFYAQNRSALLVIVQGMDTPGKDTVIKDVMSGVNPAGTEVHSFKQPSRAVAPAARRDEPSARAVVRRPGRSQVVHGGWGRRRDHRSASISRFQS